MEIITLENKMEGPQARLVGYLEDAWAVESGLVVNLKEMADDVNDPEVQALMMAHRTLTMQQKDRLAARLHSLGKEPSGGKGFLSQMLGKIGDAMHFSQDSYDKTVQNLFVCYGAMNFGAAMYEGMEAYADMIGDPETAELARSHRGEEQEAAKKIWPLIRKASVRVSEVVHA